MRLEESKPKLTNSQDVDNEELIRRIIGAAITVHKELGPGFLESVYEAALAIEFEQARIKYERQKPVDILFREEKVGEHRLDFLVDKAVIVETKAVLEVEKIFFVIVRSYLKAAKLRDALLLNFAAMPLTIKRIGPEDSHRYVDAGKANRQF
jgi:GxxExxY protein